MSTTILATAGKPTKRPGWTRAVDILLRTAHVAVTSFVFGGAFCGIALSHLRASLHVAILTGLGLLLSEIYHCRHWPYQGRGVMALLHLGLLGLIHLRPDLTKPLLVAILVLGMVGSHMPKNLRYWSFLHGRVVLGG